MSFQNCSPKSFKAINKEPIKTIEQSSTVVSTENLNLGAPTIQQDNIQESMEMSTVIAAGNQPLPTSVVVSPAVAKNIHKITIFNSYATIPGSSLGRLTVNVEDGNSVTLPLGNIPSCFYYTFTSLKSTNASCTLNASTQIEVSADRKSVLLKNVNSSCDFVVEAEASTSIPRIAGFSTTYQFPETLDLRVESSWIIPENRSGTNAEYCIKTKPGNTNFEEYSKCDVSDCIWVDQMPTRVSFESEGSYNIFAFARLKSDISKVGGIYSSHSLSSVQGCPLYTHYELGTQCLPRFNVIGSTQFDFGIVNKANLSIYPEEDPYINRTFQVGLATQSWGASFVLQPLQSSRNFVGICIPFGFASTCTIRFANSIKNSALTGTISETFKLYMIDPNNTVRTNYGINISVRATLN